MAGKRKMEFESLGKTIGQIFCMTRPIWNAGWVVILNSGFCVLSGIVELAKSGLRDGALIKKHCYWPKWIFGKEIKAHFAEKEVLLVDCWNGNLDAQAVAVFCFKEPDYVMFIMSAYGTVDEEAAVKKTIFNDANRNEQVRCTLCYTQRSSTTKLVHSILIHCCSVTIVQP
jgi:hypothetical protein